MNSIITAAKLKNNFDMKHRYALRNLEIIIKKFSGMRTHHGTRIRKDPTAPKLSKVKYKIPLAFDISNTLCRCNLLEKEREEEQKT
jgi:hypothetical protein